MRVLVTGATGLVGAAIVARLAAEGHEITGLARNIARAAQRLPRLRWIAFDIARATSAEHWLPQLEGIEGVVNCAGLLQDAPGDSVAGVHEEGIATLFEACERTGVRRVVQISAIGIDRITPTLFSQTKLRGDEALMRRDLNWVILRPSVIVGRAAYGGSALLRGLAALPILPVMPDTAPLQIVQLDEVAETVLFCLGPDAPARLTLELAGRERCSFVEAVGFRRPPRLEAANALNRTARDCTRSGRRSCRMNARNRNRSPLARRRARKRTRFRAGALVRRPLPAQGGAVRGLAAVLDRNRTDLDRPGLRRSAALMREGGAGGLFGACVMAGGAADLLIGLAIAVRRTAQLGLYAALAITVLYLIAGTALLPQLWLDPLGSLLKVMPLLVLNLIAIALVEDR